MNDLYGVDPCAPDNLRDLRDLVKIFGPSEGRFIADFPSEWSVELRNHMRGISDVSQLAMIEAWIRLSKHSILPVKVRYQSKMSWQENAIFIKDEVVKLIGPSGQPANVVQPIDKVLIDPHAFPDARGAHIPRTSESYVNAVRPIILSSPKIVIVDPYFALQYFDIYTGTWKVHRRAKFLNLLLKSAVAAKRVECLEIFTDPSKFKDASISLDDLKNIAVAAGAASIQLKVHFLDKSYSLGRHARYILGMASGLHFDHGFDVPNDGSTNHVEWIGDSTLSPLLNQFC